MEIRNGYKENFIGLLLICYFKTLIIDHFRCHAEIKISIAMGEEAVGPF